jgi:hypothetical protein
VLRLRVADRAVEDPAEQRAAIADAVRKLREASLPKLLEIGVVAPAPRG